MAYWLRFIIVTFVVWRVLLLLPLGVADVILPFRDGYNYTRLWQYTSPYAPVSSGLLYPWANFDGVHYLTIAHDGYAHDSNGRFFPLYPLVVRIFATFFGGGVIFGPLQFFSGLFLSNVFFILALVVFYRLIRFDFEGRVARQSVIATLLFPTSFFFVSIYTESLFLLLALLAFYFARKKEWLAAVIFATLLSSSRVVGVMIFVPIVLEFLIAQNLLPPLKNLLQLKTYQTLWQKGKIIFMIPFGLIIYSFYTQVRWGDFLYFLSSQGGLGNNRSVSEIVLIPQTLYRYMQIIRSLSPVQFEWWVAILEVVMFLLSALLLFVAWKKRVRITYIVFSILALLVPTLTGTFTGLPRYVVVLFPMFIALGIVKNPFFKLIYVAICIPLTFILLFFFSRGYFIA